MILTNSVGNYIEITNSDNYRVDVMVYETEALFTNGINTAWQKTMNSSFHCGEDLKTALATTVPDGVNTMKVETDAVCMTTIAAIALVDTDRFRIAYNDEGVTIYIPGDWVTTP